MEEARAEGKDQIEARVLIEDKDREKVETGTGLLETRKWKECMVEC